MKRDQWLIVGAVLIAVLIAFPLRTIVYKIIVVPIAYLIWGIYLLYRLTPQVIWWILLFLLIVISLGNSLIPENYIVHKVPLKLKSPQGPVEALAMWMKKSRGGVYFKWLIANRLGKLAYQMLVQSEAHHIRSVFEPLVSAEWNPPKPVQDYLEAGLHGSFADFPQAPSLWAKSTPTPLDHNIADAVQALESKDMK